MRSRASAIALGTLLTLGVCAAPQAAQALELTGGVGALNASVPYVAPLQLGLSSNIPMLWLSLRGNQGIFQKAGANQARFAGREVRQRGGAATDPLYGKLVGAGFMPGVNHHLTVAVGSSNSLTLESGLGSVALTGVRVDALMLSAGLGLYGWEAGDANIGLSWEYLHRILKATYTGGSSEVTSLAFPLVLGGSVNLFPRFRLNGSLGFDPLYPVWGALTGKTQSSVTVPVRVGVELFPLPSLGLSMQQEVIYGHEDSKRSMNTSLTTLGISYTF